MTYAFMKYWVEGTKEATHKLCEAILCPVGLHALMAKNRQTCLKGRQK